MLAAMPRVVYVCSDLSFTSTIREATRTRGWDAVAARDPAGLASAAREGVLS